jgi:23S rRNA (adenine2503-C2)-methyltransferase
MGEPDPLGLSPAAWEEWARSAELPAYRGRQLFDAIHRRGVRDYVRATEVPGILRERLAREMPLRLPEIARREDSADGSVKFGLRLSDGALIEAVFMPGDESRSAANEFEDARQTAVPSSHPERSEGSLSSRGAAQKGIPRAIGPRDDRRPDERFTVCLSSQTGCAVDCAFCVTGRLGGGRNLSAGEILGQLYAVLDEMRRSWDGLRIVFMGMGEPFLNPEGVLPALEILFEMLPPRRVTVSTSGITPAFATFAALPRRPNLAVSLNASDEATRTRLMPITRTHPLPGLIAAMKQWPLEARRRLLVEYVLIAGVNDREEDARRLAKLVSRFPVKINVIPLNEDPTYLPGWKRPDEAAIDRFVGILSDARLTVTVRRSRGPDASAACGQLKGRTEDPRKRARQAGR